MDISTQIGRFDRATGTVPVTFTAGEITYRRSVNAVVKADGSCDRVATAERVAEVALGVAEKIRIGVITTPEPEPESPDPEQPAE